MFCCGVQQDRDVLQLSIGRLVRELKEALVDRVNSPPSPARPSLYLYSGHDTTIMPLSGTHPMSTHSILICSTWCSQTLFFAFGTGFLGVDFLGCSGIGGAVDRMAWLHILHMCWVVAYPGWWTLCPGALWSWGGCNSHLSSWGCAQESYVIFWGVLWGGWVVHPLRLWFLK